MHDNVTTAQMVALSCLRPQGRRRKIVCSAADFPSMVHLYRAQEALGFELHVVPAGDDLNVSEERLVEAIDEETLVVAFSHVLFRTSFIVDPRPVDRARARAGRARHAGRLPVGRHRAARRDGRSTWTSRPAAA